MCSDFDEASIFRMSNSELFLDRENKEETGIKLLQAPTLESQDGSHISPSTQGQPDDQRSDQEEEQEMGKEENIENEEQENKEPKKILDPLPSNSHQNQPSLGEMNAADDDESGFKTPTSLEHRIIVKECPGAPRRPEPRLFLSTKRKASSSSPPPNARRSLQLDLSQEVESFFPKLVRFNFHNKKIKKAGREP